MEILLQSINITTYAFMVLLLSWAMTYIMIPKLIGIIKYKWFMDHPNKRSSHSSKTPTLGGITFYISFIICLVFIQLYNEALTSFNLIVAVTILFIAGLKDDLVVLSVKGKLLAQILAISLLLLNTDIPLGNIYGFLGFTTVPLWLIIGFSYFVMLSIINAYNLIDGIDGLAAMLGIVIFAVFGFVFYSLALYFYFLLALVPLGYLLAFLRYNISKKQKIFMGDTGSMITGFLIGVLTLRFLSLGPVQLQALHIQPENVLLLTLAILFVMTMDTLRVVVIRLWNNKALFKPDRNHVHHILIDSGLSHIASSIIIAIYSVLIIALFFVLNLFLPAISLLVLFGTAILLTIALLFHLNKNYRQQHELDIKTVSTLQIPLLKIKLKRLAITIFRTFF